MPITRRTLLGALSSSTFFLTVPYRGLGADTVPAAGPAPAFPQGVASGDPGPDSVLLWTRAVPADGSAAAVSLVLELARDPAFSEALLRVPVHTNAASDHTLRAHIDGLEPDTIYYYRFTGTGAVASRLGRTRTAPSPGADRTVNIAFTSCQSYEQGHFGAWARLVADDVAAAPGDQVDFVLHLGDFIYERCWNLHQDGGPQSRRVPDFPDGVETEKNRYAVSLADYRHLYRTYLADPHLQEARARWPFICTWDDHEFSNDNFQNFSTYGGDYVEQSERKLRANQVWFEYIPAALDELADQPAHGFREPAPGTPEAEGALDSLRIYRRLGWGRHLDLVLTDNRSYRSIPCMKDDYATSLGLPLSPVAMVEMLDAGSAYDDGNPPATLPWGDDVANPAAERPPGTILGETQRRWFLDTLEQSGATWKLWGNSLPLIPMRLDLSSLPFTVYEDSIFTLDPWAGYPYEVALLMDALRDRGIASVVSLSGDHHMHGAGTVNRDPADPEAPAVSVDFTVAAMSSAPIIQDLLAVARESYSAFRMLVGEEGQGEFVPVWNMSMLDGVLAAYVYSKTGLKQASRWLGPNTANPGLSYVDTSNNGYGLARFDGTGLQVRMVSLEDCRADFETPPKIRHTAVFELAAWESGQAPALQGPQFEGGAPFPFDPPGV